MEQQLQYDVIIVGGSYAGLSAAMALGRSLRKVLIIDSGRPCNRQTPHSHNFLTQDGQKPGQIAAVSRQQALAYPTIRFHEGLAIAGEQTEQGFLVRTQAGESFHSKKLLFTTGISDQLPERPGFAECWGISLLHCPYCHGYEVNGQALGLIADGELAFEMGRLLHQWSPNLTIFTNGPSSITEERLALLEKYQVRIVEKQIDHIRHQQGQLEALVFTDSSTHPLKAAFIRAGFVQHCSIPEQLGCALTEHGYISVDDFHKTSCYGVYAAGDCCSMFRAVSNAVAAGSKAGAAINLELIREAFQ
ncbi:MAG: NAD(P)/FAD-dependent oxidoreductase [Candidatus Pseudobacter hemicellulosilyticus]|uniref:NAD(P)/FAD-dependent oxidoreductase n=1 Tax=Candidatus Pseudobacter hemicellulosilyticus TaxID=3121375 RepID=A0AAJ5WWI5_9BACT|nr:MAG: NAD(P)/FAD-dependent oxidoreductase [Pseudobacter sp.]